MPTESKIEVIPTTEKVAKSPFANGIATLTAFFLTITQLTWFLITFFVEVVKPPYEFKEFVKQCFVIGYKSLPIVALTGFIMGIVLTIQARPTLAEFGAVSWLPAMVAISIVREIGPVITALIFAGKVGSSIGAELASMKVTEQIDAMEVSGINPFKYIVVTRVMATTIMLPLLVVISCSISLYGAFVGVNLLGEVTLQLFFAQVFDAIAFSDLLPAITKTIFFGFAIGLIGCYKGYTCSKG
ncbi:MAG TPA: ABC transporter permease, partial [Bacteroidia bacterium]|nr:ABC transporter permease [Bacteroidia bacterium]